MTDRNPRHLADPSALGEADRFVAETGKGSTVDVTDMYDAVIIGGGIAGLSAALVLGRSIRRTLLLDAGEPRNLPSSGVRRFFSRDGTSPEDLLAMGRDQLRPYPNVELRRSRAWSARRAKTAPRWSGKGSFSSRRSANARTLPGPWGARSGSRDHGEPLWRAIR